MYASSIDLWWFEGHKQGRFVQGSLYVHPSEWILLFISAKNSCYLCFTYRPLTGGSKQSQQRISKKCQWKLTVFLSQSGMMNDAMVIPVVCTIGLYKHCVTITLFCQSQLFWSKQLKLFWCLKPFWRRHVKKQSPMVAPQSAQGLQVKALDR